jgi:hypothetical protein
MWYIAQQIEQAALGVVALAIMGGAALAQDAGRVALPDTAPCPESIAAIATCYTARHETGAYLFAIMPKDWNGNLIVFAHGGPFYTPPTAASLQRVLERQFSGLLVGDRVAVAIKRGVAWIASTYRREGWGLRLAAEDSDDARKFFISRIATPKRTILHGSSYGGLVGAKLIETYAKKEEGSTNFDGALLASGDVAGVTAEWQQSVHARVVYQYYCNNLPRPDEPQYPLGPASPPIPGPRRRTSRRGWMSAPASPRRRAHGANIRSRISRT